MLSILLDDLRELREVADLMTDEKQYKRLSALQNKQRWLLFESPGTCADLFALRSVVHVDCLIHEFLKYLSSLAVKCCTFNQHCLISNIQ